MLMLKVVIILSNYVAYVEYGRIVRSAEAGKD